MKSQTTDKKQQQQKRKIVKWLKKIFKFGFFFFLLFQRLKILLKILA